MVILLQILREINRMPKNTGAANFGICTIVSNLLATYRMSSYEERRHANKLLRRLIAEWPPSMGDADFPLPTPEECLYGTIADPKDRQRARRNCYVAMQHAKLMWSGPYGQQRQLLLNFLIETLERAHPSESAVPNL